VSDFRARSWLWFHPAITRVLGGQSNWHVEHTDALVALRALPDNSIDACVTDPPSGISFQGKAWDRDKGGRDQWIAWLASIMTEVARVLKPGAHAFVWSLPRTSHWTGMALENAGLQVRDCVQHIFATGFPKSKNLGDGVGNALKPAHESWWLVRKPFSDTLERNYAAHGSGGLNIDACRIKHASDDDFKAHVAQVFALKEKGGSLGNSWKNSSDLSGVNEVNDAGRWPANLVFSHPDCQRLDVTAVTANPTWDTPNRATEPSKFTGSEVSKVRHSTRAGEPSAERRYTDAGVTGFAALPGTRRDDTEAVEQWRCVDGCPIAALRDQEGDARFFPQFQQGALDDLTPFIYQAKPSTGERDQGLEAFRVLSGGDATGRKDGSAGVNNARAGAGRTGGRRNHHATVKSVELIRWLTRLITPPRGVVIDPFAGSGTGGIAALRDGYRWLGFELNDDDEEPSVSVARARISWCEGREYIPRPSLRAKDSPAKLSLLGLFNKD
jgi:site-specific DNA-methyltransferase (adenine-specific)